MHEFSHLYLAQASCLLRSKAGPEGPPEAWLRYRHDRTSHDLAFTGMEGDLVAWWLQKKKRSPREGGVARPNIYGVSSAEGDVTCTVRVYGKGTCLHIIGIQPGACIGSRCLYI